MDLSYHQVYAMNKTEARRQLVQTCQRTGSIAQTARLWQTSRAVVRKWVRRFKSVSPVIHKTSHRRILSYWNCKIKGNMVQ